ncbi:MAG: hypothetical protein ACI88A_001881 [Paraglaciecola sp.]|jgi:hypothetical protein
MPNIFASPEKQKNLNILANAATCVVFVAKPPYVFSKRTNVWVIPPTKFCIYRQMPIGPSSILRNSVFLPYVPNVDSFGYNTNVIPEGIAYETESWGCLAALKHSGTVAFTNIASITKVE